MKADKDKKICPNGPESSSRLIEYSRSIESGVVVNACGCRLACKGRFGWLATARMPLLIKRRSAKSALDSVERAPVGPVVAVCRHAVLAAPFIKMGSDAAYAAYPRGRWEGEKRRKEVSVLDASCPTMPKQ